MAKFLAINPRCALAREGCWGEATTLNELIRRSHQGAIYPGQEGKRENEYHALCIPCHMWLNENPLWARENGWEKS